MTCWFRHRWEIVETRLLESLFQLSMEKSGGFNAGSLPKSFFTRSLQVKKRCRDCETEEMEVIEVDE